MKPGDIDQEFLAVVNRYQPLVHRVCRMYADTPEDRKDLFQETLFQLWRSYPSFQGRSHVATWVYRVALNTAITAVRKKGRAPEHVPLDEGASHENISTDASARDSRADLVYRAIGTLSPVERALVMLYLEDLSYREMADILGLSESNVGVKLNRIRSKLQDLVREPQ
jgi:RNA polymerase sigma-70 factor (ECF subfamily)